VHETPAAPGAEQAADREGTSYELLDPAVLQDPYPLYRQMRTEAPVYRDRRFMGWILTRYEDATRSEGCAPRRRARRAGRVCR
jgi:cytochrome P450